MPIKTTRFLILLLLGAILASIWLFVPKAQNLANPKLNLSVDTSAFIEVGCVKEAEGLNCSAIKLEEKFSCQNITPPSDALGGLSPTVAIAECSFINRNSSANEGISRKGCRLPLYNKYLVVTDDKQFKALSNPDEFRKFFGPVETPEEALSFAVGLTNSYPQYKIKVPKDYRVLADKIEDTYIKEIEGGFQVHLFDYQKCGCGPHSHSAVDYKVTKTGEVAEISRQKIYEDPKQDGLCVD